MTTTGTKLDFTFDNVTVQITWKVSPDVTPDNLSSLIESQQFKEIVKLRYTDLMDQLIKSVADTVPRLKEVAANNKHNLKMRTKLKLIKS